MTAIKPIWSPVMGHGGSISTQATANAPPATIDILSWGATPYLRTRPHELKEVPVEFDVFVRPSVALSLFGHMLDCRFMTGDEVTFAGKFLADQVDAMATIRGNESGPFRVSVRSCGVIVGAAVDRSESLPVISTARLPKPCTCDIVTLMGGGCRCGGC